MKLCPYCAEEIQDAAIRCKHCRSDLVPSAPPAAAPAPRRRRRLVASALFIALLAGAPLAARPLIRHLRAERCEPTNWVEWHLAMRNQCLTPSYVCEHMTTSGMLQDPEVAQSMDGSSDAGRSHLSELVGRMRSAYGCAPESGPAFHVEPPPMPDAFPIPQDAPRNL